MSRWSHAIREAEPPNDVTRRRAATVPNVTQPRPSAGHKDYSSTPLPRKLGIREGSRVLLVGAPNGFSLGPVPSGTSFARSARGPLDVVLLFTRTLADLRRRFPTAARALDPAGRLWVAWPKKAAEIETDLSFEVVQRTGLDAGLVDNKSGSIDEVYQGLQFVVRLKDRPKRTSERLS
jgi:hypothetical protein